MGRGIITISENGIVIMPTVPVWMTQQEMCDAFNVFGCDIRRAVHAIYKNMEFSGCGLRKVWLSGSSSWTSSVQPIERIPSICSFRYPAPIHDVRVRVK